jgi:hypothetical protein
LKTWSVFFNEKNRFRADMERKNELTDGYCLASPDDKRYVFYKESTSSIDMDLSRFDGVLHAVAVDAEKSYEELAVTVTRSRVTWDAPYRSDWALAVGDFDDAQTTRPRNSKPMHRTRGADAIGISRVPEGIAITNTSGHRLHCALYDLFGRVIASHEAEANHTQTVMPATGLRAGGAYLLRYQSKDRSAVRRIVLEE